MNQPSMDVSRTLEPDSDQIIAADLLQSPLTVTVTKFIPAKNEKGKPIFFLETAEFGPARPYKPSLNMRRVIAWTWGKMSGEWIGRQLTIYRDPELGFGGQKQGGIRISNMSHIDKPVTHQLPGKGGKTFPFTVQPLAE